MKEALVAHLFKRRVPCGPVDQCWEWPWRQDRQGYGTVCTSKVVDGQRKSIWAYAHRTSYFVYHGDFDRELDVCHSCDNPACVNPNHLWLGSQLANTRDAARKGRLHNCNKTHCKRGHEFDAKNTGIDQRGDRFCKICMIDRGKLWRAAKKTKAVADNDLREAVEAFAA
jgi:hypothetical protein